MAKAKEIKKAPILKSNLDDEAPMLEWITIRGRYCLATFRIDMDNKNLKVQVFDGEGNRYVGQTDLEQI